MHIFLPVNGVQKSLLQLNKSDDEFIMSIINFECIMVLIGNFFKKNFCYASWHQRNFKVYEILSIRLRVKQKFTNLWKLWIKPPLCFYHTKITTSYVFKYLAWNFEEKKGWDREKNLSSFSSPKWWTMVNLTDKCLYLFSLSVILSFFL